MFVAGGCGCRHCCLRHSQLLVLWCTLGVNVVDVLSRLVAEALKSKRHTFSALGGDKAFLHLIAASVADTTFTAMPYPEFVARSSVISNVTAFHPFVRLSVWAAYMDEVASWDGVSEFDPCASLRIEASVNAEGGLVEKLSELYSVVDNLTRFPILEAVSSGRLPWWSEAYVARFGYRGDDSFRCQCSPRAFVTSLRSSWIIQTCKSSHLL